METKSTNSMTNSWKQDKEWSDKFIPEIKQILGLHLIGEAPAEEDQERNTDLIVLKMNAVRIGCRVRRHTGVNGYPCFEKHADEFTIRRKRPSGATSELTKIIEGWGDYFFYAFSTQDETALLRWTLGKYNTSRLWFNRYLYREKGAPPGVVMLNKDGSSDFIAFKFKDLPSDFIVASNWVL